MKKIYLLMSIVAVVLVAGCSSDDDGDMGVKPVADFSYANDGSTFTFTNLSENGSTYRWDFGDLGFISNEENPTYTYGIGGEILVSLTVTNELGGEDFISKTIVAPEIIIIDIEIDGEFDDWEHVEVAAENTPGNGSVQTMKIWTVGSKVNVYLEGNTNMQMELVDMYINSDGDIQTGFLHSQWSEGSGADYLFEGPMVSNGWGSFYEHTDPAGGWGWNAIAGSGASLVSSGSVSISAEKNAIEFSIPKAALGSLGETIGFAFTEMTSGWALVANFPEANSFVTVEL
ncbi:PKD domain-containing protein [Reichenbachiella sp. MALMAid0571]|uniref:PKD domain-containing protein n=1 Tax=Reichenbachiella sp. MALMAid0571 TaxID=3143939 RepID=UPI0032DFB762